MSSCISIYLRNGDNFTELNTYYGSSEMFALLEEEAEYGKNIALTKNGAMRLVDSAERQIKSADDAIVALNARKEFLRGIQVGTIDDIMEKLFEIDGTIDEYKEDREIDVQCLYTFKFLYEMIDNADYDYMREKGIDYNKFIYIGYEAEYPKVGYNLD